MPETPTIAVILRLRHATDPAPLAAASFLAQTCRTWELVVVGIQTEPALANIHDPRVRWLPLDVPPGNWAAALNRAVASTEGRFIAFTDGTTLAAAGRLEMQSAFLSAQPQFGWVSGWSEACSAQGGWTRRTFGNAGPDTLLAALLHENPFPIGTVMITRACFDALGGFDEVLTAGEDHDLWLRMGVRFRVAVLPAVVCRDIPRRLSAPPANDAAAWLPDRRRRDHVERLLDAHPRGRLILEEALSRYPEDDVLWSAHARFRAPVQTASAGGAGGCDTSDVSVLWLRGLRFWTRPAPFNDLAREYGRRGNPLLAYLCHLRSLSLDARQPSIFDEAYAAWSERVPDATGFFRPNALDPAACTVSVLIATYNRAHLIRESLESVLTQTLDDLELVIIDDGSTDTTEDVVRSFRDPRIRYVRSGHRGVAAAFNIGAGHARGRYFAYLGDDDVFYRDHLSRLVAALETSQAPIVYSRQRVVHGHYESGRFVRVLELGPQGGPYSEERLRRSCIIAPQGLVHRRECLIAAGGFDERLPCFEDWDLLVRMSERFPIAHLDAITAEYRRHGTNMSGGNLFRGRLLQPLLRIYYASCRGGAILVRAASLQGRLRERERLLTALRSPDRLWRRDRAAGS